MRVLYIGKYYPPDMGGIEVTTRDLASARAGAGHKTMILAHAGQAAEPGLSWEGAGFWLRRCRVWAKIGGYAPLAPGIFISLARALWDFRPEIIHAHCPNPAALAALLLAPSVPLVIHWHSDVVFPPGKNPPQWQMAPWRWYEKWLLRRAARVVVTSPGYAGVSPFLKDASAKIRIVPSGLEDKRPPRASGAASAWFLEQTEGTRLLAIGRLSHYKGFGVLLEALAGLPQASLLIIGEGEERAALSEAIERLGLWGRVFLAGTVSDGEKELCLDLADVLCLPSLDRTEAFGLALLEAMRAGKAVAASKVLGSGMSYAVEEGRTGLLSPPGDAESLSRNLGRLLTDGELRETFGRAGRERFLKMFTLERVAALMENVYSEIHAEALVPPRKL